MTGYRYANLYCNNGLIKCYVTGRFAKIRARIIVWLIDLGHMEKVVIDQDIYDKNQGK
jgi:hypothetical protein